MAFISPFARKFGQCQSTFIESINLLDTKLVLVIYFNSVLHPFQNQFSRHSTPPRPKISSGCLLKASMLRLKSHLYIYEERNLPYSTPLELWLIHQIQFIRCLFRHTFLKKSYSFTKINQRLSGPLV